MFVSMVSRSDLELGHLESNLGHQVKSKENLIKTLEVIIMNLAQNVCLDDF